MKGFLFVVFRERLWSHREHLPSRVCEDPQGLSGGQGGGEVSETLCGDLVRPAPGAAGLQSGSKGSTSR